MNIESLGEGKIEVLFDNHLVNNYADLYDLKYEQLYGLEKVIEIKDEYNLLQEPVLRKVSFKQKTADNILESLQKSKKVPFARVLFALGIKYVGETTAKLIANAEGSVDNIIKATTEELKQIDEVGEKIALSVREFFDDERNIALVNRLRAAGLQFEQEKRTSTENNILAGKSIVVSGTFKNFSREEIKQLIEDLGGKNVSSISSKTDFVVAGEKMGPEKKKKAEALNIPVLSEEEFIAMTGRENSMLTLF